MTSYAMKPGDKLNFTQRIPARLTVLADCGASISAQMKAGTEMNIVCGHSPLTVTIDEWDGTPDLSLVE